METLSQKTKIFNELLDAVDSIMERFKILENAIELICKRLTKISITTVDINEILKLYSSTATLSTKALEVLDSIISRFPQELSIEELEVISLYRDTTESNRILILTTLRELQYEQ